MSFIAVVLIGVVAFAGINYFVDPFYFFRSYDNLDYQWGTFWGWDVNTRLKNVCVIKNTPENPIEGLIIGGSKSSPIVEELLESYTGLNYYSAPVTGGSFDYYEDLIRYALQHQPIQHVVLHLSGWEVTQNPPDNTETCRMPAFLYSDTTTEDVIHYLFTDVSRSLNSILDGTAPRISERFVQQERPDDVYSCINAENTALMQNMGIEACAYEANDLAVSARIHGAKWRESYYSYVSSDTESAIWWANKYVANYNNKEYAEYLKQMFEKNKRIINVEKNLESLSNIVDLCKEYNIELTVIVGSSSLIEKASYEGIEYWEYLRRISKITDFYDFSYFCDINMNPYNFYDAWHNLDFVSCVMIDNIYGDGDIPFGQYVTAENFDSYIVQRRQDFFDLEQEYRQTGTVVLPGIGEAGDLSSIPGEYWVEMISKNAAKHN